jgi:hypothetical protein
VWHAVKHYATTEVDTRDVASSAKNNYCLSSAVTDNNFYGGYSTAWLSAHAFDFSSDFCARSQLQVFKCSEASVFEPLTKSL